MLTARWGDSEAELTPEQERVAELLDQQTQRELISTALSEARRLNQLVGDLLDMSRIEAGALRLTQDFNEVADLVGTTLVNLEPALEDRVVDVQIPDDLPLLPWISC